MQISKKPTESYCVKCGRMLGIEDFNKSNNPKHSRGVLPYCKSCCKDIVNDYIKQTESLEAAVWLSCSEIGVPFIRKAFEHLEQKVRSQKHTGNYSYNYFGNYLSSLSAIKTKSDKFLNFSETDVPLGDIIKIRKSEEAINKEYEKFALDWGQQTVEDYQFLEYRFDVYTKDMALKPAQEMLYRQLCLVELAKRKKEESGDATKDEQAMILNLLKTLKIDNFSEVKDKSLIEQTIERQNWEIENVEPSEVIDQEYYKDYCDIGKSWGKHIIRASKNLLLGSKDYPHITDEV